MDEILRDVVNNAQRQTNGNWSFEGKDRHSWAEEARQLYQTAARYDNSRYMESHYDALVIVGLLRRLDLGATLDVLAKELDHD